MEIKCKYDELLDLNLIKPNKENPNKHPKEQIERICKIIKHYGVRHPIIISKQSGLVVVGHGRLMAAKKLGMQTFPVVYQDFKDAEEEYSFLVADNGIAEWFDLNIKEIEDKINSFLEGFDLELLGLKNYSPIDFDAEIKQANEVKEDAQEWTTLKYKLPLGIAEQLEMQINRFKKKLYPKLPTEEVSYVMPIEALVQTLAQIPDEEL